MGIVCATLHCSQVPAEERRAYALGIQTEMASVMAAAVHLRLIPMEDMLDLLDGDALQADLVLPSGFNTAKCSLAWERREWALWTVQLYMAPFMAGEPEHAELSCCLLASIAVSVGYMLSNSGIRACVQLSALCRANIEQCSRLLLGNCSPCLSRL